ncbi:unnamed protein product, partial [Didymodactylos carnosus]
MARNNQYHDKPYKQQGGGDYSTFTRKAQRGGAQTSYGLIILGNSGTGKSFLANLFMNKDSFVHKPSPNAVTKETEFVEFVFEGATYLIFNIPGLVESSQEQIDVNKREIDAAFGKCPNAIVCYVFGNQNGRIRNEDIIAFDALNDAYPFAAKSLVFVVNGIPSDRDQNYEGEVITLLRKELKMKTFENITFLETIDKSSSAAKSQLRNKLLQAVVTSTPKVHHKEHDIELDLDKIKHLTKHLKEMQTQFDKERSQLQAQFEQAQKQHKLDMRA